MKEIEGLLTMIAMEKICAGCGRRFITREAENFNWKIINYCPICRKEYNKKQQYEKERIENEKWSEIRKSNQIEFEKEFAKHAVIELSDISFDNDNVLYIIGNGFDLMHGAQSSYYAFRDSLGKNSLLRQILEEYWTPEDIWADFENRLANFRVDMMANRSMMKNYLDDSDFFREDESAANFYTAIELAANPIALVATQLHEKLRAWVETLFVRTGARPLKSLIRNGKVLNFNYTEFIEELYEVSSENVCYIHGCRRRIKNRPKDRLIMGHKPGASENSFVLKEKKRKKESYYTATVDLAQENALDLIAEYDNDLTKDTRKIIQDHSAFFDSLRNIKDVVVIGHSMSEVDWEYFKKVAESIVSLSEVNWYFGCHGLNDIKNLDKLADWLNLTRVQIFRTDKINVVSHSEIKPKTILYSKYEKKIAICGRWEVFMGGNLLTFIDKKSKEINYEVVVREQNYRVIFTEDEECALLITYATPEGIQLMRLIDGKWKYIDEMKGFEYQGIINSRLKKVFMTNSKITSVYNNRVRKYSLKNGVMEYNQAIAHASRKIYLDDGLDVTENFLR